MKYKAVLFDLDGTITDSGPGIINCVQYALRKAGMPEADRETLRAFIGPPLKEQFRDFCGITEEQAAGMVSLYRERYSEKGMFENRVYEGVIPMLRELKAAGLRIFLATSKPERYARIIADHFGFARYFDYIGGANMDGTRTDKQEVIEYVLETCGIPADRDVIMAGDRRYDIEGARKAGLSSMGVTYGYGSLEEIKEAAPDLIADSPGQAAKLISDVGEQIGINRE